MTNDLNDTPQTLSWQDVWTLVVTQPSVETFRRIVADPTARPRRAFIWLFFIGAVYGLVSGVLLRDAINQGALALPPELTSGSLTFSDVLFLMLLMGPTMIVALILGGGVLHLVAKHFFDGEGTFNTFVYAYGAIMAPFLLVTAALSIVPLPGFLLDLATLALAVYQFVLTGIALRAVHRLSSGKAAATVAIVAIGAFLLLQMFMPI